MHHSLDGKGTEQDQGLSTSQTSFPGSPYRCAKPTIFISIPPFLFILIGHFKFNWILQNIVKNRADFLLNFIQTFDRKDLSISKMHLSCANCQLTFSEDLPKNKPKRHARGSCCKVHQNIHQKLICSSFGLMNLTNQRLKNAIVGGRLCLGLLLPEGLIGLLELSEGRPSPNVSGCCFSLHT